MERRKGAKTAMAIAEARATLAGLEEQREALEAELADLVETKAELHDAIAFLEDDPKVVDARARLILAAGDRALELEAAPRDRSLAATTEIRELEQACEELRRERAALLEDKRRIAANIPSRVDRVLVEGVDAQGAAVAEELEIARRIPVAAFFDPSLNAAGAVAITLDGEHRPVRAAVSINPSTTKRGEYLIRRVVDDSKRAREVFRMAVAFLRELDDPSGQYVLAGVGLEAPSGIPHSRRRQKRKPGDPRPGELVSAPDAMAFGKLCRGGQAVYDAAAAVFAGDPVFVSTYSAKEAATGAKKPKGGKSEVAASVERLFGLDVVEALLEGLRPRAEARFAVCDALACSLAGVHATPIAAELEAFRRAKAARP